MTWVRFLRNYSYSTVRYTEHFEAGQVRNLPRHIAKSIVDNGGAELEVKRAKKRKDSTNISEAVTGQ